MPDEKSPIRNRRTPEQPAHLRNLEYARVAHYFLSADHQPHAELPNGTTVALFSEEFFTWYLEALDAIHIPSPSSSQFSYVQRQLDAEIWSNRKIQNVHLRGAKTGSDSYEFDLETCAKSAVKLNHLDWSIDVASEAHFLRPAMNYPLPTPEKSKDELATHLSKNFSLNEDTAQILALWLTTAMLPNLQPPILVITGKKRDEAATALRNLLDPVVHPIQEIPYNRSQLGELALTNRVLAFSIFKYISPNKIEALNQLSNGMLVQLREVSKRRGKVWAKVSRPIIFSTGEMIKFSDDQIHIEINEIKEEESQSQLFGALLTRMVRTLRQLHEMIKQEYQEPQAAPSPPHLEAETEQTIAPDT